MSYTTTTVSRRRFMVKANKPGQTQATPAPGRLDEADSSAGSSAGSSSSSSSSSNAGKAFAPELFLRASYRRPLQVAPAPWWKNWLAVTLVNAVVVAVVGGLYFWANGADSDESSYVPRRATARVPSAISSRPVVASPAPRSAPATAPLGGASADSSTAEAIDRAMLDGNSQLVLPTNVAGNCRIGDGGSKDFGRCLAQNGARAK